MNLGAPIGLAAAALAVPLVVWYVLRSRRPTQVVASTFLWSRTERSVAAAIPWQKFRSDATFWLILLSLLFGALALARPFRTVPAELGDHTILVLDASGSMLAVEDGPTRLELARREARELVDRLNPGQEMSIVEAGSRARVLLSASTDPVAIKRALDAVRPTHGTADLVDAFTLAAALERPAQTTVVHLLTDGIVPATELPSAPTGLNVTAVGAERPNLAVTRLQAVPVGAGDNQVFVQVRNFGTLPARASLTLRIGETEVLSQALDLGPRGTEDLVLQVSGGDGDVLVARVAPIGQTVTGDPAADALSIDDAAFAVLSAPREIDVLVVGPGNVFLEAAFAAVPGATVTTAENVPSTVDADLLVIDRVAAPAAPTVPTMVIAGTALPAGVVASGEIERPVLSFQAPNHELLADVDLSEVAIAVADTLTAPALTPIAGSSGTSLVLAGRLDGVPTIVLGFDLTQSNLPLLPAWPVFVANAANWLAGAPAPLPSTAGDLVTLQVPIGATAITVSPPSGDPLRLDAAAPRVLVDQVGLWRLRPDGLDEGAPTELAPAIAVNAAAAESDLARERPDPVVARGEEQAGTQEASEGRDEFGRDVLVLVLLLAAAEWAWAFGIRPWRRRRAAARRVVDEPTGGPSRSGRRRPPIEPPARTPVGAGTAVGPAPTTPIAEPAGGTD